MSEELVVGVRIVSIDYAMSRPMDHLDFCLSAYSGNALFRVPVIRIFGILKGINTKCCVHVHRVFPYFLVRFHPTKRKLFESMSEDEVNLYLASFGKQIEAIMTSLSESGGGQSNYGQSNHGQRPKELFYDLSI